MPSIYQNTGGVSHCTYMVLTSKTVSDFWEYWGDNSLKLQKPCHFWWVQLPPHQYWWDNSWFNYYPIAMIIQVDIPGKSYDATYMYKFKMGCGILIFASVSQRCPHPLPPAPRMVLRIFYIESIYSLCIKSPTRQVASVRWKFLFCLTLKNLHI